jgi:hypothetical protein
MAEGVIVYIRESDDGELRGYVHDDAIPAADRTKNVFFDVRCLASSAAIAQGDRVTFEYDLDNRDYTRPRMKFDSMKLIEN